MNGNHPTCPSCQRSIKNSKIPSNQPITILENCSRCRIESLFFKFTPWLVAFVFFFKFLLSHNFNTSEFSSTLGIIGALLLINNQSKSLLGGVVWDGYKTVEEELPKIRKTNILGYCFILFSFILGYFPNRIIAFKTIELKLSLPSVEFISIMIGAIAGLFTTQFYSFLIRPKIYSKYISFSTCKSNMGELIKMTFKISGKSAPGFCTLKIKVDNEIKNAKWDELPNPLKNDLLSDFVPEMVPSTYYLPLSLNKYYSIPILIQPKDKTVLNIFSGWWFDTSGGYDKRKVIDINSKIELELIGNTEIWKKEYVVNELVNWREK